MLADTPREGLRTLRPCSRRYVPACEKRPSEALETIDEDRKSFVAMLYSWNDPVFERALRIYGFLAACHHQITEFARCRRGSVTIATPSCYDQVTSKLSGTSATPCYK